MQITDSQFYPIFVFELNNLLEINQKKQCNSVLGNRELIFIIEKQQIKKIACQRFPSSALTLINVVSQRLQKAGLVRDYSPTTDGDLSPSPQCPVFSTLLFCIETIP